MKADLRISIKDYHRNKSLKILLFRPPLRSRVLCSHECRALANQRLAGMPDAADGSRAEVAGEGRPKRVNGELLFSYLFLTGL
jgi:hypothetical protein